MNKLLTFSFSLALIAALVAPNGAVALTPPLNQSERLVVYRMYNPSINDHFYTSNLAESSDAYNLHGYKFEGAMGAVERYQQDGTISVLRMWNSLAKKHFYTTDAAEAVTAQSSGFVLEGSMGFIQRDTAPQSLTPTSGPDLEQEKRLMYRMYNSSLQKHFYTIDKAEMTGLLSVGYALEGDLGTLYDSGILYPLVPHSN